MTYIDRHWYVETTGDPRKSPEYMDRQTDDNSFGKGEADSSILSGSTIQNPSKPARLRS